MRYILIPSEANTAVYSCAILSFTWSIARLISLIKFESNTSFLK